MTSAELIATSKTWTVQKWAEEVATKVMLWQRTHNKGNAPDYWLLPDGRGWTCLVSDWNPVERIEDAWDVQDKVKTFDDRRRWLYLTNLAFVTADRPGGSLVMKMTARDICLAALLAVNGAS